MSLRAKILFLFAFLAIAPIITVGILDYFHSIHTLEQLVRAKVEATTETSAGELGRRYTTAEAELRVLGGHDAVRALLSAPEAERVDPDARARAALDDYVELRRDELTRYFTSVEILDPAGQLAFRLADVATPADAASRCPETAPLATLNHPVTEADGAPLGSVVAVPRLETILPLAYLEPRFGSDGYNLVLDRTTGAVIYSQRCEFVGRFAGAILGAGQWTDTEPALGTIRGEGYFGEEGDRRFAAYVALARPPWTVVTTAAINEFTVPFARMRHLYIVFVLVVALGAAGGFSILSRGVMRSLGDLTRAANRIGRGQFDQWLPPPGSDEVGRLSYAFATMVERLRRMMRQVELNRQMAVVGKMSSYLAHEIRNPLSSIRLNLQGLSRDARRGEPPPDLPDVVEMCLQEVDRLETVVQSVLKLRSARPAQRRPVSIHRIVRESADLVRADMRRRGVQLELLLDAEADIVDADAEQIKGVILNLFLNGADAMNRGGRLFVRTAVVPRGAAGDAIAVHVIDEGPGVPPELRDEIFEPFFTTKRGGSGIGLSLCRVTAEHHGGRLHLQDAATPGAGAEFVLELPLASGAPGTATPASRRKARDPAPAGAPAAALR